MTKFLKTNFYYFLIIIFFTININTFEKIYLIYSNDYNKRLGTAYGFCNGEGYGFVKNNINDKIINSNFSVKNYGDFPSIKGFFYEYKSHKINDEPTYIFLISYKKKFPSENYLHNYKVLKNEDNCFFLKKND